MSLSTAPRLPNRSDPPSRGGWGPTIGSAKGRGTEVGDATVPTAESYKKNGAYRASAGVKNADAAKPYYRRYLKFITLHLPRGSTLLDIGSSTGMSAFCLSR